MTAPDITAKIAAARALEAAATPGPWFEDDGQLSCIDGIYAIASPSNDDSVWWRKQDLAMAIHARNHHAALWDVVEAVIRRGGHTECEDGFYACPQSDSYFGEYEGMPVDQRPCSCGWDDIAAALAKLAEAP